MFSFIVFIVEKISSDKISISNYMKIKKISIFSQFLFIFFILPFLVNCSTYNGSDNIGVDGGADSRIVGKYKFTSSSEYLSFYQIFKKHNSERFLCPVDFNENSFNYCLRTEGIKLSDFEANRYDIDFDLMNMFFEFEFEGNKIMFETFDIKDNCFANGFSVIYDFLESNNKIQVQYFFDNFLFATTSWINNDLGFNEEFINNLNSLTIFLEESIKYAF